MSDENAAAGGSTHALADGNEIPGTRARRVAGPRRSRVRQRGAVGARGSAIATSTPLRPTATRRASARGCATAASRARTCSSRRSSTRAARTRWPRSSTASSASASTTSTSTSSTGRRAAPRGRGRGWSRPSERGHARSIGVSNFWVAELEQVIAAARSPPVVNQVQFSPFEYRRGAARGLRPARRRARGLQPARHRPAPLATTPSPRSRERLGRTPAQVLLRWCVQRDRDRDPEVDAPGAHRGERADLRLQALRRGHGRARRARPNRRHRAARERKWW